MSTIQYPPFAHWEVTPECNHNCIHCYNYWRKDKEIQESMYKVYPENHYLSIAQKIIEQKPNTVVITGGEPLLVYRKIKSSLLLLKENEIHVTMNTNLTLINHEIAEFLKEMHIAPFVSFPCSEESVCDFITNKKGSLKNILKSLDVLVLNQIGFTLNVVVSKANISYLWSTICFLKERYNIRGLFITRVAKPVNSSQLFDKYLLSYKDLCELQDICVKAQKVYGINIQTGCPYPLCAINSQESFDMFGGKKSCTGGITSYAVDFDGNVKACPRDSEIYGNILTDAFEKIWDSMIAWRNGIQIPIECENCDAKNLCKGGCRVDAFPIVGNRCSLDTSANLNNLPIRYKKERKIIQYNVSDIFETKPYKAIAEKSGYRISHEAKFLYVTDKMLDFLANNNNFTMLDLMQSFSVNQITVNYVIGKLIDTGIIKRKVGE
ncbi:MAG: radical SAM protein [Clostridia bacterium]|nr:radical SAM protein [Clostridia bacterium]